MEQKCTRCGFDNYDEPIENNANYVQGADMVESRPNTVMFALKHTELTRTIRDRLVDNWSMNITQANRAMAAKNDQYLKKTTESDDGTEQVIFDHTDLSDDDFERVETNRPITPEEDAEIVKTVEETAQKEVQKTGIVCPDCVKDTDVVIW